MSRARGGTAVLVIVVLAAAACALDEDATDGAASAALFGRSVLHGITMEITERDLARLEPPTDARVPMRLVVDGRVVEDAGVRLKSGGSQYEGLDGKPGFSIKTDEFVDGQDLLGVMRFTLGNARWDASFVAEQLVYDVFRAAGVPVARTALARVAVNGEAYGLYVMRESYDRRWLERHFDDPGGNLYEASDAAGIPDTRLELRTNERRNDTRDLEAVADVVANASDEAYRDAIEQLVDVDELLTYWAVEAIAGHWDGYLYDITAPGQVPPPARPPGNPEVNNFYAYHDPSSGRFAIIPHGADLTLGLGGQRWSVDPSTPVMVPPKADATIAVRLWSDPAFRMELAERMLWVLDEVWDVPTLLTEAGRLAALVRADGLLGARERFTLDDFEAALASRRRFLERRPAAVRAEVDQWLRSREPR